jgi:hypothetical protein
MRRTLVIGAPGAVALLLVVCGRTDPSYYVDGARPSPGANTRRSPVQDSEYQKGCVPWSEERPDVYICAPVPEGWTPPPPPGSYADYPAVCDDAAKAFEGQGLSLADRYQLRFAPVVDVETCGAAGMLHGEWQVRFGLANAEDVQPYRSATSSASTRRATRHLLSRSRGAPGQPCEGVYGGSLSVTRRLSEAEGAGAREAAIIRGRQHLGPPIKLHVHRLARGRVRRDA